MLTLTLDLQFYEDVMVHGHPESYDDAILESGNHNAKVGKRILFWGGTNELDPTGALDANGNVKRIQYAQQRSTGKRDNSGALIMKTVMHTANPSVEVAHLENTYLHQTLAQARTKAKTAAELQTELLKHEAYGKQCDSVQASLEKLDAALAVLV